MHESKLAGRDDGITLLAVYHFLVAGLFLLGTVVMAFPTVILGVIAIAQDPGALIGMFAVGLIGAVTMVFCLVYLSVGYGLWKMKQWARVAAIRVAVISSLRVPIRH
ncbi:MAG: hypothetical protein HC802_22875, partial [Caldilineaceae bacterium]|nr:hypothetical protein [Caldilineaceae bacterium]